MVRICGGGANCSFLRAAPACEHAPFPRHEPSPIVAEYEFSQAPSETQESVPTFDEIAPLHASDPRQDLSSMLEESMLKQAYSPRQDSCSMIESMLPLHAKYPLHALYPIGVLETSVQALSPTHESAAVGNKLGDSLGFAIGDSLGFPLGDDNPLGSPEGEELELDGFDNEGALEGTADDTLG